MTSPRRFRGRLLPLSPSKSPSVPSASILDLLIPGPGCSRLRAFEPCRESKKQVKMPSRPQALHRSSQLAAEGVPVAPPGARSLAAKKPAMRTPPRVGGDEVLRRDSRWRSWLREERECSRLMQRDMIHDKLRSRARNVQNMEHYEEWKSRGPLKVD